MKTMRKMTAVCGAPSELRRARDSPFGRESDLFINRSVDVTTSDFSSPENGSLSGHHGRSPCRGTYPEKAQEESSCRCEIQEEQLRSKPDEEGVGGTSQEALQLRYEKKQLHVGIWKVRSTFFQSTLVADNPRDIDDVPIEPDYEEGSFRKDFTLPEEYQYMPR